MQFSQRFFHSTRIRSFLLQIVQKLYHSISKSMTFLNPGCIKKLKFEIALNATKRLEALSFLLTRKIHSPPPFLEVLNFTIFMYISDYESTQSISIPNFVHRSASQSTERFRNNCSFV